MHIKRGENYDLMLELDVTKWFGIALCKISVVSHTGYSEE